MRGRNKPWADAFILEHANYLLENKNYKFDKPTYLEIGIGKGDFIIQSRKYYQDVFHIGIEVNKSIFALALKKIVEVDNLDNIALLNIDATNILDYIPLNSIDKIFLNFSDPWPKKRHAKRRLVSSRYLKIFKQILKSSGQIVLKTDNKNLMEYAKECFDEENFICVDYFDDYQTVEGDFVSEYETRFRSLNQPIYRIIVKFEKEVKHESN